MILVIDNGSVYTSNILKAIDVDYTLKPYHADIDVARYNAIILSGRRSNDNAMNVINARIVRYCYNNSIPLLGICYGAEIMALALGGGIRRMKDKIHGMYEVIINSHNPLIDKDRINVFESHSYYISRLPNRFRSIAYSSINENEIIMDYPLFGVQFHPEMSNDGKELISNFINLIKR